MDTVNLNNGVVTEEDQIPTERPAEAVEPEAGVRSESFAPEHNSERDRLTREKTELQELLQRRQAEFENYRRRVDKERYDLSELAAMDTVKALLPALDDFERALKSESADKEYARGMELIYNRFYESMRKLGLEPISNEVTVFNPHIHHAVDMMDTKDHPDQTVLAVYQTGYYFKGRLLRPAMVKVAVNQ